MTNDNSFHKEASCNIISKIVIINELHHFNTSEISKILECMRIEKMTIFSIDKNSELNIINSIITDNGSKVLYLEMKPENFVEFLSDRDSNFTNYNVNSMYIIRDGTFKDIKNLFNIINGHYANVGRGGGQKSHVLSPLDFRLSCYLLALFNFNHQLISSLNTFNLLNKNRYLS